MKHKYLLINMAVFLLATPIFAQLEYTWSQFAKETVEFVKQPLKWDGNDFLKMGLVGAGTGLLMFADEPIRDVFRPINDGIRDIHPPGEFSFPMEFGRIWGDLPAPIVLFGGFAAYSLLTDDIWSRKVAYEIGQAALYGGGLVFIAKYIVGRARPYNERGSQIYKPFHSILNQDYHSMPSGHNAAAFIISTVLSRNVEPVWLKIVFYIPAALTYASRLYQDKHWTSDEFMGGALGFFIATWVVDKHEKAVETQTSKNEQSLMDRIDYQPILSGDFYGLTLSIRLL